MDKFRLSSSSSTLEIITQFGAENQTGLGSGTMKNNRLLTHVHDGIAMRYQALELTGASKSRMIIILTNQRHDNVYKIRDAIEAILDGRTYQPLAKNE
ncbi:hypothetical protein [Mucilaginibacter sp.]|uniref:hypothetical protein n=1 Tax=Mucilaginibacter sp. TaxID=1882438 RepID=UPI0035BC7854